MFGLFIEKEKGKELANALPSISDSYIIALHKKVADLEKSFIEVLKLEQCNDYKVWKDYQYKTWDSLPSIVARYLTERFGFTFTKIGTLRWLEECYKKPISSSECIGESFDKYKTEFLTLEPSATRLKRSLADFTSAQLSEVMEAIVEVLNTKKETEKLENP